MALPALLVAAALAPSNPNWEAGVVTSYVRSGSFDGPGIAVHYLWTPGDYFAVGPTVEVAYLSSGLQAGNGLPASYAFTSTFAGGIVRLSLPLHLVEPYAAFALGYVDAALGRAVNTQCRFAPGLGGLLAVGGTAAMGDHLTVGLRGSVRSAASGQSCTAIGGPATFDAIRLFALSSTLAYRW
jgi:hypothetical protein